MTDPERISKRSLGLAAQLLQAGAEERPAEASVQQTLAALGVAAAILSATSAASAVAGAKATSALGAGVSAGAGAGSAGLGAAASAGAVKAVSATLLVKWIGIGVVGGVGLAGVAAVATGPAASPAPSRAAASVREPGPALASRPPSHQPVALDLPRPSEVDVPSVPAALQAPASLAAPHISASEPVAAAPALEVGAPLAAEVAYVDRARALLVAGQAEPGLKLLRGYERDFPEARLLPEVLFLQLETCDRLGRASEARMAAQRLLEGFPKSPHASRARKLLFP